jgi:AraC-like DNA-binding protein
MKNYISPDRKLMDRLQELIEANFKVRRELCFYCDALSISLKRLNRITGFYFKKSLYQLLQDRIHQEAVLLLSSTMLTSREICFELGVCDPAHFSKCFKQMTGMSPSEFRKEERIRIVVEETIQYTPVMMCRHNMADS